MATGWMDQLVAEAIRQGFKVWQTPSGAWTFRNGPIHVEQMVEPDDPADLLALVRTLRGAGLVFPPEE